MGWDSTQPKPSGVTEILSEYVRQRRLGRGQQEVIAYLRPILERLRIDARNQLASLIRSWETREGGKYKPEPRSAALEELDSVVPPTDAYENLSWLPGPDGETVADDSLEVSSVHPSVVEQREVVYCRACGRANAAGDAYCFSCGAMIVVEVETRTLEPDSEELVQVGKVYYSDSSALLFHIVGEPEPLTLRLQQKPEMIVGRRSTQTSAIPDIDLSSYRAAELGVSRVHARLLYQDNTVTLTDLGSVNHTFINGQRLHAHEVRVLRDGDELRFGRLVVRITLKHRIKGLH